MTMPKLILIVHHEVREFWRTLNQPPPDHSNQTDFRQPQLATAA